MGAGCCEPPGAQGRPIHPSLCLPRACKRQQKASIQVSSVAEGHWHLSGPHMDIAMPIVGQHHGAGQTGRSHRCTCWRTGAQEGEEQAVNELWQQLTRSGGFFWRRPEDTALSIRHAAYTEGTLPDPGETGGWRTWGREPWAVTGATARIRLSHFAEIGLAMLMLLVPFQQRRKQRDLQERPAVMTQHGRAAATSPALRHCPPPPCQHTGHAPPQGTHLRAGSSLGPAARAGEGGGITRKTSMRQRAVSAPWGADFY